MHLILAILMAVEPTPGATASPHETTTTNPILPATNEIIWGSISFAVLAIVMIFFLFPALQKALKKREDRIKESLEHAEEAKSEADQLLDEYRQKLAEARAEGGKIMEEARKTAEAMRKELLARAQAESDEIVSRSALTIQAERQAAIDAVRREAAGFSVELAERIVKKTIDRDAQARLIEEYIKELERLGQATS